MKLRQRLTSRWRQETAILRARLAGWRDPYPDVTFVTAANAEFFIPLKRLLFTLSRHENHRQRTVVFDLGLQPGQLTALRHAFPSCVFQSFDVTAEIPWCRLSANAGFYAWKPLLIKRAIDLCSTDVLWLDSSVIVRRKLWRIRSCLRRQGFYAPLWERHIRSFTHPSVVSLLNAHDEADLPMLIAAVVGFARTSGPAIDLLQEWVNLAHVEAVMSPKGATTATHKGDQCTLSILAYQRTLLPRSPANTSDYDLLDVFIANRRSSMFVDRYPEVAPVL